MKPMMPMKHGNLRKKNSGAVHPKYEMREFINIVEDAQPQLYLHLGDLPKGGKSAIGAAPNIYKHIERNGRTHEKGVSVYPVEWDDARQRWEIDCNNYASLDGLFAQRRPAYLVTGQEIGHYGMDDEPLLKGVKIVQEVPYDKLFVPGWGETPQPEDFLIDYDHDEELAEDAASNEVLYHLTPTKNVASILKQGLLPQSGPRSQKAFDHGIFLFPTMEDLEDGWEHWLQDEIDDDEPLALLKVTVPSTTKLTRMGWEVCSYEPIPPEHIEVVTLRWGE
jgi:hypothetical protein